MGGGGSAPPAPPSPDQILQNSEKAASAQLPFSAAGQASSQYDQNSPYGSVAYGQIGQTAQGTPLWGVSTQFSPSQQTLYNQYSGTQALAGSQAANALNFGNYSTISPKNQIGNMTQGTTGQLTGAYLQSVAPFFQTQRDQLDAQLVNQGFSPNPGGVNGGTSDPAYDNAMRQLTTNQDNAALGAAAQFENQGFNQATQLYGLPLTVGQQLASWGAPGNPTTGFSQNLPQFATPSVNQAFSSEMQAAENQYEAQQAQYNAQQQAMSGLFGVGGNILGDMALGGMMWSDVRLKHNIVPIGQLENGLGLYRFSFNGSTKPYIGVLAQEVLNVRPDAVMQGQDGYLMVNYSALFQDAGESQ